MTQILIKRTGTAGQVPEASKLVQGELCLNYGDGRVFFKNGSNTVQDIGYIKTQGDVGKINPYSTTHNVTLLTVDQNTPDECVASGAITVSNGPTGKSYTKVIKCTAASPSVTLGTNWKWQNGSALELKQNGFLVVCWVDNSGLAIFNNVQ